MPGATTRLLNPPRTVDPYYHQAERMASIEARLALLEQGAMPIFYEVGVGAPVPGFQNGYANYAPTVGQWARCGYWLVGNRVYLQGLVYANNAAGSGIPIFTLPAGFRPAYQHLFSQYGNVGVARVDVQPSGFVANQSNSGWAAGAVGGSSWFLSLDGINFPVGM